jgi:hypothetical protein
MVLAFFFASLETHDRGGWALQQVGSFCVSYFISHTSAGSRGVFQSDFPSARCPSDSDPGGSWPMSPSCPEFWNISGFRTTTWCPVLLGTLRYPRQFRAQVECARVVGVSGLEVCRHSSRSISILRRIFGTDSAGSDHRCAIGRWWSVASFILQTRSHRRHWNRRII